MLPSFLLGENKEMRTIKYVLTLFLLVGSTGCVSHGPLTEDVQPALQQRVSSLSVYEWYRGPSPRPNAENAEWSISAWRGERVQIQLLVRGISNNTSLEVVALGAPAAEHLDIALPLTNGTDFIESEHFEVRFPTLVNGDIEARNCDGYPDKRPLIQIPDALALEPIVSTLNSGVAPIWISLDIPAGLSSGKYEGQLLILAAETGHTSEVVSSVDISINVLSWQLPPSSEWEFHLNLWQFPHAVLDRYNEAHPRRQIEAWSDEHFTLLEPTYRYLASLGQKAVTTHIKYGALGAPSMIQWIAHDGGTRWTFDYSAFDRFVEHMEAWGIDAQIDAFSPVGWNKDKLPFWDADTEEMRELDLALGTPEANAIWHLFLRDFEHHLQSKGWFEKTVLYMDEVSADEMRGVIGLIKHANPDWKIGLAYSHEQPPEIMRSLYDVSGIFETEQNVETYPEQVTSFYTSCTQKRPNIYIASDASPADASAMAWYASSRRYDGYLRWAFDRWMAPDPLEAREGLFTAGDGSFVYRGLERDHFQLVRSIRSELLRDGIEDVEKMRILRESLAQCNSPFAIQMLDAAVQSFTAKALTQGQAPELIRNAKSALETVSGSNAPGRCR